MMWWLFSTPSSAADDAGRAPSPAPAPPKPKVEDREVHPVPVESAEQLLYSICNPAPFDSHERANKARDLCDYTTKITLEMAR